jgi:hypothetical protein
MDRNEEKKLVDAVSKVDRLTNRLEEVFRKQMANEKSLAEVKAKIAEIKGRRSAYKIAGGIGSAVLLSWLAWMSITLIAAKGDILAMKQRVKDFGLGDAVSSLSAPASPDSLKRDLRLVSAKASVAALEGGAGVDVKSKKFTALSKAVAGVTSREPSNADAWQAASQLINLKSVVSSPEDRQSISCFAQHPATVDGNSVGGVFVVETTLRDCILKLDDLTGWAGSPLEMTLRHSIVVPHEEFKLNLVGVRILYSGGPVIPVRSFTCVDCSFRIESPGPPPQKGAELIQNLLVADLENRIDVNLG